MLRNKHDMPWMAGINIGNYLNPDKRDLHKSTAVHAAGTCVSPRFFFQSGHLNLSDPKQTGQMIISSCLTNGLISMS